MLAALASPALPSLAISAADPEQQGAPREETQPSTGAYLARGLAMMDRPRPEDQAEGTRLLRKVLRADPASVPAHVGLARSSLYLFTLALDDSPARLEGAEKEARQATELAPDDPVTQATLALVLAASDRLTPALEAAHRAVELSGDNVDAQLALCIVERQRHDIEPAVQACRRAAALAPDRPRVLVAMAEVLRDTGEYHAAMELCGQAADLDHESALPQLAGAATLQKSERLSDAFKAYDIILDRFPFVRTRALQGAAAAKVAMRDYETALDLYERIDLPSNGALPTLLSLYGKGYALLKLDRPAEAEYFLTSILERVPAEYDGPARGREVLFLAYEDLARYFEDRGRKPRAEELLREATNRPLAPTRLARHLASLQLERGLDREAVGVLEAAIRRSDPQEDPVEISDTALLLARTASSGGRRRVTPGSAPGRALSDAADQVAGSLLGAVHYRMARAFALARDEEASLLFLDRARTNGYLPVELAAAESDFSYLRDRPAFQSLLAR
jgi:tetratricopeptide (TPR) repeat protein